MTARRPDALGAVTSEVLDVLERYTMFPWPLLKTQAERTGAANASDISVDDLERSLDAIEDALVRFSSPDKGARAAEELRALIGKRRLLK